MSLFKKETGLHRYSFQFKGVERFYQIYIPDDCTETTNIPVVVSLHGGDHPVAPFRTHWNEAADKRSFLVVYPETIKDGWMWNAWDNLDETYGRQDDVEFLDELILSLPELIGADPERIYLHGQSMGDMMGTHYAFEHPDHIAAAYLCSGPTKTKWWMSAEGKFRFAPSGQCPVMRLHGENDCFKVAGFSPLETKLLKHQYHVQPNELPWIKINACERVPLISTTDERNVFRYKGQNNCDFYSVYNKEGVHRPPEDTELFGWDMFFSHYILKSGHHVEINSPDKIIPDTFSISTSAGKATFLVNGVITETDGEPTYSIDSKLFVDILALLSVVPHLKVSGKEETRIINGKSLALFSDVMDENGYCCNTLFDTSYATDHSFRMTFDMAYSLRSAMCLQRQLTGKELYTGEDFIYLRQIADAGFNEPVDREEEVWQWGHTV